MADLDVIKVFRKEVVFVVDISGSMRGQPLEDTKSGLLSALAKLGPKDLFNVIAFNGETCMFSSILEPATAENIENANNWVDSNFVASGDTNIMLPLNQVVLWCPFFFPLFLSLFLGGGGIKFCPISNFIVTIDNNRRLIFGKNNCA